MSNIILAVHACSFLFFVFQHIDLMRRKGCCIQHYRAVPWNQTSNPQFFLTVNSLNQPSMWILIKNICLWVSCRKLSWLSMMKVPLQSEQQQYLIHQQVHLTSHNWHFLHFQSPCFRNGQSPQRDARCCPQNHCRSWTGHVDRSISHWLPSPYCSMVRSRCTPFQGTMSGALQAEYRLSCYEAAAYWVSLHRMVVWTA